MKKEIRLERRHTTIEDFCQFADFYEEKIPNILRRMGVEVLKHDTSIYDCNGVITIGHYKGTTVILDNFDHSNITIIAIGERPEIADKIASRLLKIKGVRPYSQSE